MFRLVPSNGFLGVSFGAGTGSDPKGTENAGIPRKRKCVCALVYCLQSPTKRRLKRGVNLNLLLSRLSEQCQSQGGREASTWEAGHQIFWMHSEDACHKLW